jgi:NAD-dependent DNA ligase
MDKLNNIMLKENEVFRAKAYSKAKETLMSCSFDITSTSQLKGKPGIGETIMSKLNEYVETGTLSILERDKNNPINIFSEIYGVGPKKAQEIVSLGINNIDELTKVKDTVLNNIQRIGLYYYYDIQQRIPRAEIKEYENIFKETIQNPSDLEIVGSYRRGANDSGDIDVIIKGSSKSYTDLVNNLRHSRIILEILSSGPSKTLVIAKLPGHSVARRVDFLFTPDDEFAFAILYFTGSKWFNTAMRQFALDKGYTFNEHGMYRLVDKKKGPKVNITFKEEIEIFEYLGLEYKLPHERRDGRDVIPVPIGVQMKNTPIGIIENFKLNGIKVLDQYDENMLSTIIKLANDHYYNETEIMTDNQYDIIKEYTCKKYPKNPILTEVGAKVKVKEVELPYPMPSLNKIKADTNALTTWINKFPGDCTITCKLDGVSGLYTTQNGNKKLYTRGDGLYGQDISHMIPYLNLPNENNISIRGEFIMPKSIFKQKYEKTYANARNMYIGIFRSSKVNAEIARDIQFIGYEVLYPEMKPSEQLYYLNRLGCCVRTMLAKKISNNQLSNLLVELRENHPYNIDGLVVKHDAIYPRSREHPLHAFAFKMVLDDQIAESIVVDVLWSPSKDGYLKPRVQIQPVELCGVTIEFATGFNASFIYNNKIGVGATIQIIRSGDVIPHIKEVITPAETPKMPDVPYKWNNTNIDIILLNATDDPTVKEKNITGFFKGIDVEGLGTGNVSRLINAGYDSISKILSMTVNDFLKIDGFKEKMANKLFTNIQEKINNANMIQLMASTNIFGRGFSIKKIEIIMQELPDILISNESQTNKISKISSLKGFSDKTAEAFVDKIIEFIDFLKECNLEHKLSDIKLTKVIEHPLSGKTIVLTGTRDKQITDFLKNIGCNIGSNVSKNTALLIAKRKDEDTGKAGDARKLNIPILTIEEFILNYINK